MAKAFSILIPQMWYNVTSIKDRCEKSYFIRDMAKLGAQLVFIQNQYLEKKDDFGRDVCELIKSLKITPRINHTETEDIIYYHYEKTNDIDGYIKDLSKGETKTVCLSFEDGFKRWIVKAAKEYKFTSTYLLLLLLNYGTALHHSSLYENREMFHARAYDKIREIRNHIIHFSNKEDKVTLQKITSKLHINPNEINLINKIPAGDKPSRVTMSKTAQDKSRPSELINRRFSK